MILTDPELAAIRKQAEAEYPAECCGVVLVKSGGERRLFACRNIQDQKHAEDPDAYPRTSRTAYYMHAEDIRAFDRLTAQGYQLHVIYHSHVDAGAYFSETDKKNALANGEPLFLGAIYVVMSVREGRAAGVGAFQWDPKAADFVEIPLATAPAAVDR